MGNYTAYFDESGTHGGSIALVVSGWVASDEQWCAFEPEWRDMLVDFGITSFHMRDFNHGRREFESRKGDRSRQIAFSKRAVEIIRAHVRRGFAAAVILKDYQKVNEKYQLLEYIGSPYPLAALTCINKGNQWIKAHGYTEHIRNVFEDGAEGKGEFLAAMRRAGQPDPVFMKKALCTPFQIADLAAYELFKKCTDLNTGIVRSRRSFENLFSIPNNWEVWEGTSLERLCQVNQVPFRESKE
jgi:hypothetical protein